MSKKAPEILDPELYEVAKEVANKKYKKQSAYKSGFIVKLYKALGGRYSGKKKEKEGLSRWFAEDWRNIRGTTGYKFKSDIYRPTKRVSKTTPKTFSELTEKEIKKARREKAKTGKVKRF